MANEHDRILQLALEDFGKLLHDDVVYAGLPHFFCLFGRDSIITSLQLLDHDPRIARSTLLTLAKLQGKKFDPVTEEEPGKILHEYRVGPEAKRFSWPFPYFGTIDATPLFLVLLAKYHQKTGDLALVRQLWENALWALNWLEHCGDIDNDGFVEYERKNPRGLRNQGWKDSHDAIHHADGTLAEPPIALVEVQGYTYQALASMHYLAKQLSLPWAFMLKERATRLWERLNAEFWMEDQQFYAMGLAADKQQIKTISSNTGHLLYCGAVPADRAKPVVARLMSDDMFSGWGIRTISAASRRYDPLSYHNGSVWFHDNWLTLRGFENYGYRREADRLRQALVDAACRLEFIPELFSGEPRGDRQRPALYRGACHTQAWAAGTIINILAANGQGHL